MSYDFDLIVIGAGSGGLTTAIGASRVGKKVCLIEKGSMGGDCTNTGCIPSKSLIHYAREYAVARERSGDTAALKKFRHSIMGLVRAQINEILSHESPEIMKKQFGITVKKGEASFVDAHRVMVGKKTYTAKYIVISTGSHPVMIDIPGLYEKDILTNETLFSLKNIPGNLVILGGGVIGCEMAEAFALLGSKVTIVTNADRLLPREEVDISRKTEALFEKLGITICFKTTIASCRSKKARVRSREIPYDYVLMAIGRKAHFSSLNLEGADVKYTSKGIVVDHHYRTSQKHIFAIGDVSSKQKFTHIADEQGRHIVRKILLPFFTFATSKPIPKVTYLRSEIASVGLTWHEARAKYSDKEVIKLQLPFEAADRAKTDKALDGEIIVIAKRLSGKILGASIMGDAAGELLHTFVLAMQQGLSLWKVNKMICAYPTRSRLIKKISDQFVGETFKHLKRDILHVFKKHAPKVVALIFWAALAYAFYSYKSANNLGSLDIMRELYAYLTGSPYGAILYIVVYAIRPLILFPATLLTLLSGALFGFWGGTLYTIIGENLSANLAYGMGRLIGQDTISGEGTGLLSRWKRKLQENSFVSVFIMRLIYLPFDMVNYLCGVLKIRWTSYVLATFIGILPGLVTFVSFGASIENIEAFDPSTLTLDPTQLIISFGLFGVSLLIAKSVRKRQRIQS